MNEWWMMQMRWTNDLDAKLEYDNMEKIISIHVNNSFGANKMTLILIKTIKRKQEK